MKKIKNLLLVFLSLSLITGCNDKEEINVENYKTELENVLNSKTKFVDENNKKVLLKDYKFITKQNVIVDGYAYTDLDKDGNDELIVKTNSDVHDYIIFHYQNKKIYSYVLAVKDFKLVKTDGTYIGSDTAQSQTYLTMSFDKNKYSTKQVAIMDISKNIYKINDKNVSREEINNYVNEFNKKEDVKFIKK